MSSARKHVGQGGCRGGLLVFPKVRRCKIHSKQGQDHFNAVRSENFDRILKHTGICVDTILESQHRLPRPGHKKSRVGWSQQLKH